MQTGHLFNKILRNYNVKSKYTEPNHPHHNPVERRIQEVKRTTTKVMDRTGTPEFLWFYAIPYFKMVLNYSAMESQNWITPYQACFGMTPDISALLQFYFYQPIYYAQENSFPNVKEQFGHWLGVTENKGDALTYYILSENKQILVRLLVCPITNTKANLRCPTPTIHHDFNASKIEGGSKGYNKYNGSNIF